MKSFLKSIINLIWAKKNFKFFIKNSLDFKHKSNMQKLINSLYFENHVRPIHLKIPENKKILVIAPHPDDETLGCGGLLIQSAFKNCKIHILSLSSGLESEQKEREAELELSAYDIGIQEITFLRLTDGNICDEIQNENYLAKICDKFSPDIILTPFLFDHHLDHVCANKLFLESINDLDIEIWCYQVYNNIVSNAYCDITEVIDKKTKIINNYDSQTKSFDYAHWNRGLNAWNSRLCLSKKHKFIESYFIAPKKDFIDMCKQYFL